MIEISEFKGEYAFLSNFYPSPIVKGEIRYPSVENFFQAHKTDWIEEHLHIAMLPNPGEAKHAGRMIELRDDWEEIKGSVMYTGVLLKFLTHDHLAQRLLATGNAKLVEGNHWGDQIWGATWHEKRGWIGENRLGKALMNVRAILEEMN